jgi:DNA-binding NtrC family response regulator
MVEQGTFREDLYYRLNVVNINIPPLRERPGDISLLVNYFIKKYCTNMSRDLISIEPAAMKRLEQYDFPGNVRELENMIERAIVVGNGKEIRLKDLPMKTNAPVDSSESLSELERKHILQTLNKFDWNISRSAKVLKVDRVTLYNKIKKYDLKNTDGKK